MTEGLFDVTAQEQALVIAYFERSGSIFRGDVAHPLSSIVFIVAALTGLTSGDPRAPLRITVPAALASRGIAGLSLEGTL
jgi:hypothetical protein